MARHRPGGGLLHLGERTLRQQQRLQLHPLPLQHRMRHHRRQISSGRSFSLPCVRPQCQTLLQH
eukprot:11897037-Alexandrium_andersonii.AAC.1